MLYPYYKLSNGNLISKEKVDRALDLIAQFNNGHELINLTESELFSNGDKFDATIAFYRKHNCTIGEAKAAIEFLRDE